MEYAREDDVASVIHQAKEKLHDARATKGEAMNNSALVEGPT
jgi:hypothetical protein